MSVGKPEFVVFYAWQSDRPPNRNRYLIQDAATEAAERINRDDTCPYRVKIDQDTQGVPGLCDIPATVLQKIDAADALLCDLTYVAVSTPDGDEDDGKFEARYCSNPNSPLKNSCQPLPYAQPHEAATRRTGDGAGEAEERAAG